METIGLLAINAKLLWYLMGALVCAICMTAATIKAIRVGREHDEGSLGLSIGGMITGLIGTAYFVVSIITI